MYRFKHYLYFFFFFFSPFILFAQQGSLKAILVDAKTNQPVPLASVMLLKAHTEEVVKSQRTADQGFLWIQAIDTGLYDLKISYVGYENLVQQNIRIATNKTNDLGRLLIQPSGEILKEVVIEGRVPAMQMGIDRKVFQVGESLVSVGGSASDVLSNVPTLQVDQDGSVSLRGSTSVKILIDGRESALAGSDISSLLQSLPANAIEKVEVITNPSSKYDAEGQSGIINIVLKKNIRTGLNGTVNGSAGLYNNYMAGLTLNYKDHKVNYYGAYNFNRRHNLGNGYVNNLFLNSNSRVTNESESYRMGNSHTIKGGVDYDITDKTFLGLSSNISIRDNNRGEDLFYQYFNNPEMSGTSNRTSRQYEDDLGYEFNLDFKQKFQRTGEELYFNANYGRNNEDGTNHFYQNYSSNSLFNGRRNATTERGHNANLQLDYVLPFNETRKLEAGYRSQFFNSDDNQLSDTLSSDQNYYPDYSISNGFNMHSAIHALYANYSDQLTTRLAYQLGMRAEDYRLNSTYLSVDPANNVPPVKGAQKFFRWYPTVFVTYQVGSNTNDKIQLSYTRRVQRPRGFQVNPFMNVSDDKNIRQGNPTLLPEDIHSFELGFAKQIGIMNLITSAFFRKTNDVTQPFIYFVDETNNVTYSRWENMTNISNTGLEIIAKFDFSKKVDLMANVNFGQTHIAANSDYDIQSSNGFTSNTNLSFNYRLTPTFSTQLRGEYYSPRVAAQGKIKSMQGMDLAFKKDVFNKKASIMLNIRDVFNSRKFRRTLNTEQLNSDFEMRWMRRMATLSFSYRFGLQNNKKENRNSTMESGDGGGEF